MFVHGISNADVVDAPRFADIVGDVLARLDGAVLVAHNAVFEEQFLAAELARAGVALGPLPALCTLRLAQVTIPTPNHKLPTLARHAGIATPDAHTALGDVRTLAALLPTLLAAAAPATYACSPPTGLAHGRSWTQARPKTRAVQLRRGRDGWRASLMARLPITAAEASTAEAAAYLEALSVVMHDGRVTGDEAAWLARLAGSAGVGALQVAALNERFLETMREAAFEDQVLTAVELRQLRAAAAALNAPGYFDDLTPTPMPSASGSAPAGGASDQRQITLPKQRRCGHYRSRCPELLKAFSWST